MNNIPGMFLTFGWLINFGRSISESFMARTKRRKTTDFNLTIAALALVAGLVLGGIMEWYPPSVIMLIYIRSMIHIGFV
jgi:fatty acid desaturase